MADLATTPDPTDVLLAGRLPSSAMPQQQPGAPDASDALLAGRQPSMTAPAPGEQPQPPKMVYRVTPRGYRYQTPEVTPGMNQTPGEVAGGYLNAISRGFTSDLSDKGAAALEALWPLEHKLGEVRPPEGSLAEGDAFQDPNATWSDKYNQMLDYYRNEGEQFAGKNPVGARMAWLGGALSGPLALKMARAIMGAPAVVSAATDVVPSLASRIGKSAAVGAGYGAAGGFARTNDSIPEDVAGTALGAVGGGLIGGALPIAGSLASRSAQAIARALNPAGAVRQQGTNWLAQRIAQDVVTNREGIPEMKAGLREGGPGEGNIIADMGGAGVLGELGRVYRARGPGKDIVGATLANRAAAEGPGLQRAIQGNVSDAGSAYRTIADLGAAQRTQASPIYERAYAANQSMASPVIDRILRTRAGKQALADAAERMDNDMSLMAKPDPELTAAHREALQLGLTDQPSPGGVGAGLKLITLDRVKKAFDGQIGRALSSGDKDAARSAINLKNGLLSEMDRLDTTRSADGPGLYAQARQIWGGLESAQNAVDAGTRALHADPDILEMDLAELSPENRALFRQGMAHSMITQAKAKTPIGEGVPTPNVFAPYGNQLSQERLSKIFDTPEQQAAFEGYVQRGLRRFATKAQTTGNSYTAGRVAEDYQGQGAAHPALAGFTQAAVAHLTNEPVLSFAGLGRGIQGMLAPEGPPTSPLVNAHIARILTEQNPEAAQAYLDELGALRAPRKGVPITVAPAASAGGDRASKLGLAIAGQRLLE